MSAITLPLPIPYREIDMGMERIERFLNWPGYIPVASAITGLMRQVVGISQIIASLAIFIFDLFRQIFIMDRRENQLIMNESVKMLEYATHGIFNIFRGQIEAIPLIQWSCFLYDQVACWRRRYPGEIRPV